DGALTGLVTLFLNGRELGFMIGLFFFGVHLMLLGVLAFRSGYVPKILGLLIAWGGLIYFADSSAQIVMVNYEAYADSFMPIVMTTAIGELALMGWLIWTGFRRSQT
ncbi:MAG: DUF4386 domain-containing protein, partial [Chloroflexota bacterium]